MRSNPNKIFEEYQKGLAFKNSLGTRGMFEQNRINERFWCGDQWYGARCGNDRPLVRHNVIKRIGEYKIAQVLSAPFSVNFSAEGIESTNSSLSLRNLKTQPRFDLNPNADSNEINLIMSALGNYQKSTAERVGFTDLCETVLKNSYICGASVLYTYWNPDIKTGLYSENSPARPISGDICCEVLDIENVFFADPYLDNVQKQPYIIIASRRSLEEVLREAESVGRKPNLNSSKTEDGKILVLTKLYKEYKADGAVTVKCIKVTESDTIRQEFDTGLYYYPLSIFSWEKRGHLIYGDSEITYLIPNQIAINRMVTANVWASMSSGMPIMVVNGDTVTEDISNEPGQILKVFGSNEDVSGAVHYVTPPDFSLAFSKNIEDMIENTLTHSGVNEAARGDSVMNNATALINLRNAATLPMSLAQNRFYSFIEDVSRIWVDFWIKMYGNRYIKISDESGVWYLPFDAERYENLQISAKIDVGIPNSYGTEDTVSLLTSLYEKGILSEKQYLKRLPKGIIPDLKQLLIEKQEKGEKNDDR